MEIKVVIPTYRRAGEVMSHKAISPCILCVTRSEEGMYREHYPDIEIVVHPDSVKGLALKRQWIYDEFKDVFMVDDDIVRVGRLYLATRRLKTTTLSPEEAYERVQWCGNMAKLAGCYLFGFNRDPLPIHYQPFAPIQLSGAVTGCAFGLLEGSGLKFIPETVAVEDFYISGINAHSHRKAFLDLRFNFYQVGTFMKTGGLSEYRTLETERSDTLLLRRYFGDAIIWKNRVAFGGGRAKIGNKNPYGRTLYIPF